MPTSTVALYAPGLDNMLSHLNAVQTHSASVSGTISYSFAPTPIATTTAPGGAAATVWNVKAHEYAKFGKHVTTTVETEQFILNEHYFRSPAYPKKDGNSTGEVETVCQITTGDDNSTDDNSNDSSDDSKSSKKSSKKNSSDDNSSDDNGNDDNKSKKSDTKKKSDHKKRSSKNKNGNKSHGNKHIVGDDMKQAVCVRKSTDKHGKKVTMTHTFTDPRPFATAYVEYTTTSSAAPSSQTISASVSASAAASLPVDVVVVTQTVGATPSLSANSQYSQQGSTSSAFATHKSAQILLVSTVVLPALLAFVFAL